MKTYSIFNQKYDCEIWVELILGSSESLDTIKELINYELDSDPSMEAGYLESYPFFQANWEIVGYGFEKGFNFNQVIEVPKSERAL